MDWLSDPCAVTKGADVLVILTEWNEFRALDLPRLASGMKTKQMVDLRNIYDRGTLLAAGFEGNEGVGR